MCRGEVSGGQSIAVIQRRTRLSKFHFNIHVGILDTSIASTTFHEYNSRYGEAVGGALTDMTLTLSVGRVCLFTYQDYFVRLSSTIGDIVLKLSVPSLCTIQHRGSDNDEVLQCESVPFKEKGMEGQDEDEGCFY